MTCSDSAVLLEVQTLGDRGLRYRHRLGRGAPRWMHLNAIPALRLADTCGAGRLVHRRVDCKINDWWPRRVSSHGCPRRSVGTSLWPGARSVELWLRGRSWRNVRRVATSIYESDIQSAQWPAQPHHQYPGPEDSDPSGNLSRLADWTTQATPNRGGTTAVGESMITVGALYSAG
jgi:hypothetical protein